MLNRVLFSCILSLSPGLHKFIFQLPFTPTSVILSRLLMLLSMPLGRLFFAAQNGGLSLLDCNVVPFYTIWNIVLSIY